MLDIVVSYNYMQFQGQLMNQTWENGKNLISGLILTGLAQITPSPPKVLLLLDVRNCCKLLLLQLMIQTQENGRKTHFWSNLGSLGHNLLFQKSGFVTH